MSASTDLADRMRAAHPTPAAAGVARLVSLAQIDIEKTAAGDAERWLLYSGIPCLCTMGRMVNNGQPIYLLTDLATLVAPERLKGFWSHYEYEWAAIGTWHTPQVDATGIRYRLEQLALTDSDRVEFPFAVRVAALTRNRFPLQASIGIEAISTSRLERAVAPVTVNGRTWDPADYDAPLLVLTGGRLREASTCLEGADSSTGAGLARPSSTPPPQDPAMPPTTPTTEERLKAQLNAHDATDHGLIANLIGDGKTDAQIAAAVHAAQLARKDAEIAKLKEQVTAKDAEIARLAKPGEKKLEQRLPAGGGGDTDENTPASMSAALARHAAELKGVPMAARLQRMHELYPALGK